MERKPSPSHPIFKQWGEISREHIELIQAKAGTPVGAILEDKQLKIKRFLPKAAWARLLFVSLAVFLTMGVLWFIHRPVTPKDTKWNDVVAEAKAGRYTLIGTAELRKYYEKGFENILLVDTRQGWEFRTGHIPGAINFPMEPTRWSRWRSRGALEAALGTDKNRLTVFY